MISYLTLFLLVFDMAVPPVKLLGGAPISAIILMYILIGNELASYRFCVIISRFKPLIILYFIGFIMVLTRLFFSGAFEASYLLSYFKASVILFTSLLYLSVYDVVDLDKKLINIFFLNSIVCFICGSFPELLSIVYYFKPGNPEPGFIPYRNAFLSGSGFFGIGAPYCIMIAFCCYVFAAENKNFILNFIKFSSLCVAAVLAARTAFLGIAFGFIYLGFKKPLLSVVMFSVVVFSLVVLFSMDIFSDYAIWVFEIFNSDSSGTKTGTESTDELVTMYFIPKAFTLIFGDGQYSNGDLYYMNTDAGYMRNILFGGVFFTSIIMIIPVVLAKISESYFYILVIIPLVYIIHGKGAFILNNPTAMPLLIFISEWFYSRSNVRNIRGI